MAARLASIIIGWVWREASLRGSALEVEEGAEEVRLRGAHLHGLVIELRLTNDFAAGETIYLSLAQAGATAYYPPQPIDDAK